MTPEAKERADLLDDLSMINADLIALRVDPVVSLRSAECMTLADLRVAVRASGFHLADAARKLSGA